MSPRKFLKIFLLAALCASACRFWQPNNGATPTPTPVNVEEIKSRIPFNTKEPEIFQTEIVTNANNAENKIFAARNGANQLTIYDYQTASETASLQLGGVNYLIARHRKIYTENQTTADDGGSDELFSVAGLLNQRETAAFELLSDETDSAKYRITLDASKISEIIVTVDKKINLPVKQEFFSINGEQKTLMTTTELKNFSLQTDGQNFELPKDFKKVSPAEFYKIVRTEPQK